MCIQQRELLPYKVHFNYSVVENTYKVEDSNHYEYDDNAGYSRPNAGMDYKCNTVAGFNIFWIEYH